MAKQKGTSTKKAAPRGRSSARKKTGRRSTRRRSVVHAGFSGAIMDIGMGLLGAVAYTKLAPLVPIANTKVRDGLFAGLSAFVAMKSPKLRPLAIGMGVASSTMLAAQVFPALMAPGNGGAIAPGAGGLKSAPMRGIGMPDPFIVQRMRDAAQMNGPRDRTIMGAGNPGDYRQRTIMGDGSGGGYRDRTLVGSGDIFSR